MMKICANTQDRQRGYRRKFPADAEAWAAIAAYQENPTNPQTSSALMEVFRPVVEHWAIRRASVLGREDAYQEGFLALYKEARSFNLQQQDVVAFALFRDVSSATRTVLRRRLRAIENEVPIDELDAWSTPPSSDVRLDLYLAMKRGVIRDSDWPLLRSWCEGWYHAENRIINRISSTKAVENRLKGIFVKLRNWAHYQRPVRREALVLAMRRNRFRLEVVRPQLGSIKVNKDQR